MASYRTPGTVNGITQGTLGSENMCRIPRRVTPTVGKQSNVSSWSLDDRFINVLRRTGPKLPEEIRDEFMVLLEPQSLAIIVGVLVVWAASHAFGVGFIADIVLLVVGAAFLGYQVWSVADDFAEFVKKTYYAKSDSDLEQASRHLANFIAVVGVGAFLAVLAKGAKGHGSKLSAIKLPPTSSRAHYMRVLGWGHKPKQVTDKLDVAIKFFTTHWKKIREFEKGLGQSTMDGYIKGIDFSKNVFVHQLRPNQKFRDVIPGASDKKIQLVQFTDQYQTNFYTIPGTNAGNLAIPKPDEKMFKVYEVVGNIEVLVSKTAGLGKNLERGGLGKRLTGDYMSGGAYQIIIPAPSQNLKLVREGNKSLWKP